MAKSIKEIAKLAGVSKTTVSIVMNDQGDKYGISPKTQRRVRGVAKKHNYVPHRLARSMRVKDTHTIGLVVPDHNNWFFSQLSQSLDCVLREAGYRLYVTSSYYDVETEYRIVREFLSWNVDGLIVASVMERDSVKRDLFDDKTPIVYIDRRIESDTISWVSSDNFRGSYDLVSHLCSKGCREIVYMGGTRNISTLVNRFEGYKQALADHGIPFKRNLVFKRGSTAEDGYHIMKAIHKRFGGFPEAIYAASCDFMVGLLRFVRDKVGDIPSGLMIGAFDDDLMLDFLSARITSVKQDTDGMADAAFRLIKRAMEGDRGVAHEIIPPRLIVRE